MVMDWEAHPTARLGRKPDWQTREDIRARVRVTPQGLVICSGPHPNAEQSIALGSLGWRFQIISKEVSRFGHFGGTENDLAAAVTIGPAAHAAH